MRTVDVLLDAEEVIPANKQEVEYDPVEPVVVGRKGAAYYIDEMYG